MPPLSAGNIAPGEPAHVCGLGLCTKRKNQFGAAAQHKHEDMAEQPENVACAGAAVVSFLRQHNAEDLQGVTSATKERRAADLRAAVDASSSTLYRLLAKWL